jgi:hypothetical protein
MRPKIVWYAQNFNDPAKDIRPRNCPLHHPTFSNQHKSFSTFGSRSPLKNNPLLLSFGDINTFIRVISQNLTLMHVEGLRIVQQLTTSRPVIQICGMHTGAPKPAFGIHQYLPFLYFYSKIHSMKLIKIGRSSRNHIVIIDKSEQISRFHAEIYIGPDSTLTIKDISSNGTWLNGARMSKGVIYNLKKGDHVSLAKRLDLHWESEINGLSTQLRTNFLRDLKNIIGEATKYREVFDSVGIFFKVLLTGPNAIWSEVMNVSKGNREALIFQGVGMAAMSLTFYDSSLYEDIVKTEFKSGLISILRELLITLILGFILFLLAYMNYKVFKSTTSVRGVWPKYFELFCYTTGFYFGMVGLISLPELALGGFMDKAKPFFKEMELFSLITVTIWSIYIWIKSNIRLWG